MSNQHWQDYKNLIASRLKPSDINDMKYIVQDCVSGERLSSIADNDGKRIIQLFEELNLILDERMSTLKKLFEITGREHILDKGNVKPVQEADSSAESMLDLARDNVSAKQPRGKCLIFANFVKNDNVLQKDIARLKNVFEWLGYEVNSQNDLGKHSIMKDIEKEADNLSTLDHDSFFAIFLSHGNYNAIMANDNQSISHKDIVETFVNALKGKAKIFFFVTCQVSTKEPAVLYSPKDCVIIRPASFGQQAIGKTNFGTFYVQALCDVLEQYNPLESRKTLDTLLKDVARKVIESYPGMDANYHCGILEDFYFFPQETFEAWKKKKR